MRDYTKKAKRIDNGKWIEGFYFCMEHTDKRHSHHFIIPLGADLSKGRPINSIQVEVDPDTICEPTGLTDKNGNMIWENDILKHYNKIHYDEPDYYVLGVVKWDKGQCRFSNYNNKNKKHYILSDECVYEVTGNILDNPELLKEV